MNTLLLLAALSIGQFDCIDGKCYIQNPAKEVAQTDDKYEWKKHSDEQYLLYKNGSIVGQWYVPEHSYYQWIDGKNDGPRKPPIDPPGRATESLGWQKSGVHTRHDREQVSYGGKVIQPHRLHEAFEGKLEDDSAKGSFVIVAKDKAARDAVFADWQKLPTDFTSRYNVWMAPPDHFSMYDRFKNQPRYFTEGDPTVILQDKDGTVLFRRPQAQQKYHDRDMQDLLKADPNYNPKLDPGAPVVPAPAKLQLTSGEYAAAGVIFSTIVLALTTNTVRYFRKKR